MVYPNRKESKGRIHRIVEVTATCVWRGYPPWNAVHPRSQKVTAKICPHVTHNDFNENTLPRIRQVAKHTGTQVTATEKHIVFQPRKASKPHGTQYATTHPKLGARLPQKCERCMERKSQVKLKNVCQAGKEPTNSHGMEPLSCCAYPCHFATLPETRHPCAEHCFTWPLPPWQSSALGWLWLLGTKHCAPLRC